MKKIILSMFTVVALASCGGADPAKEARESCDCFIKANTMKADDPNRAAEQEKCSKMSMDSYTKHKDDAEFLQKYNEELQICNKEVMEKSMESYK